MDEKDESFEEFFKRETGQSDQPTATLEVKKSNEGETFEDFFAKETGQKLNPPTGGQLSLSGSPYTPVESTTIGSGPLGSGRFIKPAPTPETQETEIDKIAKIPYADQETRGFSREILKSYSDPKTLKEIEQKVPWYRPTDDQLRVLQTHDREKTAKQALSEIGTAAWDAFTQGPALLESMVKGGVGIGKDLTLGALAATHAPIVNAFGDQAAKDRVNQMMDKGIVSSRVLADAALGTGEAIIEPLQRMAKGGSSWTDSLLNADKSEEELFQNYKNRYISRVADYEAKEINPAVLARFTNWFSNLNFSGWDDGFADPIKPNEVTALSGPLARDLGAGVISLFSPSVEARLARHNGDRKAAAIEKQTEDLAASNEMFDAAIARANQLKEDPEQVGFVGLVTPFNEFAAAGMLSKGLGAATKAGLRGAREFGKTAEEINLLRSAQAAAAIKKTTDAAQSLEKAGMLERALEGGAKGLEYIEGKGTQIFERVPEGLRPFVKQGAVLTGLTGLGAALSDDEALGVKTGALLYGASKVPGVVSNLIKARRIGAGAGKGMFETAAMMPNEMRATTTALAKIAGKKGDWIVDTAKDALKSNIHMAPLALALGIYNDEDAAGIARTFVEGGYLAGSHQLVGKIMGRDPIAVERKRKARNMAAEKALLGASPDHRKNVDDLTWDRVVDQRQAVAFRAAKAHAEAAAENPDSDNAKKLFEEKETAERLYREAMGASVETRQRFAEEMRGYFGDAEAFVNGSLSPGSNTKIELLTTEQIKDRFRNSGGIAPTASDLLPFEKSLGQSIAGGRPVDRPWFGNLKDQIIINFDKLVSDSQFTGEALPTVLSHEIGHDLWKRKEYRTLMMPAYTELFGDEKRDENGNVIAGKAGIYDDEILFGMYGQKYLADHTPETVKQFAIASGLWDFENNTINRKAAVQYMREEVLADAMTGNLFAPPDSPIGAGLKWVESKITNALLKRVLSALNAVGVDPSVGEASGAVFTPEVRNMVREANRLIKQHEGIFEEVDPENIDPQSVITKKDILASKDLLQKYHSDSGKFVTKPSLVVIDADGTVIGQRPITTPNVFEGQWDYAADESGAVTPVRKRGYGPLPPEAEGMNIPDGATVRVQREIAYDNNGKPIEKSNSETRDDILQRNEAIRAAIVGAADGTPGEVKPFTASGMSLRGKLTQKQRSAIMALPESIVPLSIKEKLFKVMDTIAKDDGSRLNTIYAARLNERGGYTPFAPEMRDFTPVSVTFSKDGNFLANTFSVSGLTRKLNLWKQHMPGKFAPWNGDMDAFKSDFQKYLKNWEPIWEDADGNRRPRPGQSDLDADPQVAMAKKNVFNDLIGVSSEEFNPEVSELPRRRFTRAQKKRAKQSDPNTIFRSYRLDAMTDLVDSPVPEKYRIDYGLAKINFMPEGAEGSEGVEPVMEEREQPRATTVLSSNPLVTNATYVPPAAGRTQFKPAQEDPTMVGEGFFSQAGRVLLNKMPNKASAEQLKNILDPQKGSGVKGEELKWSGFIPFIESVQKEKGAVTKADVEQFLRDSYAAKFETRTLRQSKSLEGEFYSEDPSWGDTAKFDTIEEAEKAAMDMFGLSRSEAEDFVSETNQIDSEYGEDETQYSQYTLPNGKNYEETVLRMPNVEFTSTHFPDVPNYVAHMRTAEHGNGLVVEEFQTDLHQKARKEGYNEAIPLEEVVSKIEKDISKLSDEQSRLLKNYEYDSEKLRELESKNKPLNANDEEFALTLRLGRLALLEDITDTKNAIDAAQKELEAYTSGEKVAYKKDGVADAPFRKDWPLQLFKYALQKAVATGKEWIGWTTGETQVKRYDLSTKIDQIAVHKRTDAVTNEESRSVFVQVPAGEGSFTLGVNNDGIIDNADKYSRRNMLGKNIADVFGKEMAQKIMDANSGAVLKDDDLKIGGKGMYGFYDDILPKELGRYVKQWGGKVEQSTVEGKKEYAIQGNPNISPTMTFDNRSHAVVALNNRGRGEGGEVVEIGENPKIWRINITPEMRSGVEAGQARFMPERPTRGININDKTQDFTGQILRGEKTIETRDQNRSLAPYVGKRVGIISTGKGPAMLRGLADIGDPIEYKTPEEFRAAQGLHQVTPDSLFDIKEGRSKFGYPLSNIEELPVPQPVPRSGRVASNIEGIQFMPASNQPPAVMPKTAQEEKQKVSIVIGAKAGEHGFSFTTVADLKDRVQKYEGQKAAIETVGELQDKKEKLMAMLKKAKPDKQAGYQTKIDALTKEIRQISKEIPEIIRRISPEKAAYKLRAKRIASMVNGLEMEATPAPFTAPTQGIRDMAELGDSVHDILLSEGFRNLSRDFFGVEGLEVEPISGTWKGKVEPSFVLSGPELTFEKAAEITKVLSFAFAQDAGITYRPSMQATEGIPAAYLIHGEQLSQDQLKLAFDKAIEVGVDISTTPDGLGIKALNFDVEDFASKIAEIQKAAAIDSVYNTLVDSDLYETKKDFSGSMGQRSQPVWLQASAAGQPLLQRSIDSLLVPYAKATAAQGYIFEPELFAKRFGLDGSVVEYIKDRLYPAEIESRSASPLLDGREVLNVRSTYTAAGKRETAVPDMIHALQMRSAQNGVIQPGDYSERAGEIVSSVIADEVEQHMRRAALNPSAPNAIGWYDAALKRMKAKYSELFPFLKVGSPEYNADKSFVFDCVLGITSQGNDVYENGKMATRVCLMLEDGKSLSEIVKKLSETFGNQTRAIENNLLKLEALLAQNSPTELRDLMLQSDTVSNWNKRLKSSSNLFYQDAPLKVKGGSKQVVTGFMVFGPKIGSFINNLHGDYSTLTADLWYTRTWNRILGRSFQYDPALEANQFDTFKEYLLEEYNRNEAKKNGVRYKDRVFESSSGTKTKFEYGKDAPDISRTEFEQLLNDDNAMLALADQLESKFRKGGYKIKSDLRRAAKNWIQGRKLPEAAPRTDLERTFQQKTMEAAQEKLRSMGYDISIADMQAALWYNEKELFQKYGAANSGAEPADYATAADFISQLIQAGALFQVDRKNKTVRLVPDSMEAKLTKVTDPDRNLMKRLLAEEKARKEAEKARKKAEGEEEEDDED